MKLTCVTAVFNAIKSGNRENLIRCVRSVAALKTEHEHLIYDGGSTDGTVELLRELAKKIGGENRWTKDGLNSGCGSEPWRGGEGEKKVGGESRWTKEGLNSGCGNEPWRGGEGEKKVGGESRWTTDGLSSSVDAFVSNASDGSACSSTDAIGTIASTVGGESGALGDRALPENDNSAVDLLSRPTFSHPRLRVVSEPDTGIYNALNKGVRDAQGEWLYVLGCDDYITNPSQVDALIQNEADGTKLIIAPVEYEAPPGIVACGHSAPPDSQIDAQRVIV